MRTLLFLLLAVPQDAEVLVGQLGDDDIEVRERAAQKLSEMGAPVRPALVRAAKGVDAEIAGRARSVLGEITLAENRRKVFGPVGKVTIPEGEHRLQKIAGLVREQTEIALSLPKETAGDPVKISAKDELLWPFLDRLCRAHGGIRLSETQRLEAIVIEKGAPGSPPVHYSGPFRVWIERIRLERRDPFDKGWNRGSLVLNLDWPPNIRPLGAWNSARVVVREIAGDDRKTLRVDPDLGDLYPSASSWGARERAHRQLVTFDHPAAGVKKLSRIKGSAALVFPQKIETVTFEKPMDGAGKDRAAGAFTASLLNVKGAGDGIRAVIHIVSPHEKADVAGNARRADFHDRFRSHTVLLVDPQGKEHPGEIQSNAMSMTTDAAGMIQEALDYEYFFAGTATAASIRFEFVTEYFEKIVEFEFKDLELP